jgi:HEAT repeat protein
MMRYVLILIFSLFHASSVWAYSSAGPEEKTTKDIISTDDNSSDLESNVYLTASKDNFPVQLGAFRIKSNADALYNKIISELGNEARIIIEDGLYKVRVARDSRSSENTPAVVQVQQVVTEPSDSVMISDTTRAMLSAESDTLNKTDILSDTMENAEIAKSAVRKIFFLKGDSPWLLKINYFGKSLAFVNALIATIIFSIASMIILLIIILLNKRRLEREEILHQYLLEKYQGLIIDYLFGNASPEEFSVIASNTYRRQVLIDQMIDVSVNLKGDEGKKLLSLYKYLNLDKDSIARAYDIRWHKKIKGFRELAFMNIKDANDEIYKALNSKNDILRMEAQIAMVRLSESEPFDFLSHLKTPFSLWEQITLHELIIQHNIPVPSFQKWLTSPNPTVVMFCLRMIREFKQKEAEDSIRETILHPETRVKQLAIQVAGDLNMRSTCETMKHMYKNQEYSVCLEIIRSLGKMPDLGMLGFLKMVLDKEDDVQLQIEATKAIENNGEEGVAALVKMMESEYKNYSILVRHVLDRRIY